MSRSEQADHPVAGQIVGNKPEEMAGATRTLDELGFDVIDLNFACPVRKALGRKRGGFLMSEPENAIAITRAVCGATDKPVTLKLRQKFAKSDSEDAFFRIAEGAFDAGAAGICAHARSVEQKYAGPADWDFLARVKAHFGDKTILGPRKCPVGQPEVAWMKSLKMVQGDLGHFTSPDAEDGLVAKVGEDLSGKIDRHRADGQSTRAEVRHKIRPLAPRPQADPHGLRSCEKARRLARGAAAVLWRRSRKSINH